MANGEIKTRLTLEGEQQYRQAMSQAQTALKRLNSEEKLAEAQFKATGDAQELAAEKARILQERIEEQEKVVQAAQKALEEMASKGVDKNSTAYQNMQMKLNSAKTSLLGMQSSLDANNQALEENAENADEAAESAGNLQRALESIGEQVSFKSVGDALSGLQDKISSVAAGIVNTLKGVWNIMTDAGQWADDLATDAVKYGMSTDELQQWQYAANFVDTEVETMMGARSKLIKSMASDSESTALMFNKLGVATKEQNGELRDSTDVFLECIDALGRIDNEAERDAAAMELFGKSARELNPLIMKGSEAFKNYMADAPIVDPEHIERLNEWQDAYDRMMSSIDVAKYNLLSELAPTFTEIADSMAKVVSEFNEFLKTEEGQQAMKDLSDALKGMVEAFVGDANGDTFQGLAEGAAGAVKTLTGALEWLEDPNHIEGVKNGLMAIAIAWGGLTLASAAANIANGVNAFRNLFAGGAGAAAAGGGGAAASGAAIPPVLTPTGSTPASSGVGGALGILKYGGTESFAIDITGGLNGEWLEETKTVSERAIARIEEKKAAAEAAAAEAQAAAEAAKAARESERAEELQRAATMSPEEIEAKQLIYGWLGTMLDYHEQFPEWGPEVYQNRLRQESAVPVALGDDWTVKYGLMSGEEDVFFGGIQNAMDDLAQEMEAAGLDATTGFTTALSDGAADAQTAGADMANGAVDGAMAALDENSPSMVMYGIGENAAIGLANGIMAQIAAVQAAAAALAQAVSETVRAGLEINSPSRVMAELGGFTAQGFAEGIEGEAWRVNDAVDNMLRLANAAPSYGASGRGAGARAGEAGGDIRAYIVMDKEIVGELVAPTVDGYIGASITERR